MSKKSKWHSAWGAIVALSIILGLAASLLQIFGEVDFLGLLLLPIYDVLTSPISVSIVLLIAVIGILLTVMVGSRRQIRKTLVKPRGVVDPRFAHLTIHYSQRTDNPDTPNPARPRYVANNSTKQAYWVSDLLESDIKQHKLQWHSHDGEKALKAYFRRSGIHPSEVDASLEQLGLRLARDGSLSLVVPEPEIVSKLKGRKLDDFRIIILYPWYCRLLKFLMRRGPPSNRLLLRYSTNEAFDSPLHDLELIDNEIIDSQNYIFRPMDNAGKWCRRRGYIRVAKRFTENQLLGGASS